MQLRNCQSKPSPISCAVCLLTCHFCAAVWDLSSRCTEGFSQYVAKDELVKAGSSITKSFTPLYPQQTAVVFDIYGCLQKAAK